MEIALLSPSRFSSKQLTLTDQVSPSSKQIRIPIIPEQQTPKNALRHPNPHRGKLAGEGNESPNALNFHTTQQIARQSPNIPTSKFATNPYIGGSLRLIREMPQQLPAQELPDSKEKIAAAIPEQGSSTSIKMERTPTSNRRTLRYSSSLAYLRPQPLDIQSAKQSDSNSIMDFTPLSPRRELLSPFGLSLIKNKQFTEFLKHSPSLYSKRFFKVQEQMRASKLEVKPVTSRPLIRLSAALTSPVSAYSKEFPVKVHKPILKSRSTSPSNTEKRSHHNLQHHQPRTLQFSHQLETSFTIPSRKKQSAAGAATASTLLSTTLDSESQGQQQNDSFMINESYLTERKLRKKLTRIQVGFQPVKQLNSKHTTATGKQYHTFSDLAESRQLSKKQVINSLRPNIQALQISVNQHAEQFFSTKPLQQQQASTASHNSNTTSTKSFILSNFGHSQFKDSMSPHNNPEHSTIITPNSLTTRNNNNSTSKGVSTSNTINSSSSSSMLGLHLHKLFSRLPTQKNPPTSTSTSTMVRQKLNIQQ